MSSDVRRMAVSLGSDPAHQPSTRRPACTCRFPRRPILGSGSGAVPPMFRTRHPPRRYPMSHHRARARRPEHESRTSPGASRPCTARSRAPTSRWRARCPTDLVGAYLRNGPEPEVHARSAATCTRWRATGCCTACGSAPTARSATATAGCARRRLRAEERAGRALYGGLMTPAFVDQSLLGDDPDPGWPTKLDAFINIVRHAGRYLALEEGSARLRGHAPSSTRSVATTSAAVWPRA